MVGKEKEKEMGEDEETDRHRRISKEQRELLQSQHTKHQMLFSSVWNYAQMSRQHSPADTAAHTHTHTAAVHICPQHSDPQLDHSSTATTICTQGDGENARWSDNTTVGGIIIKVKCSHKQKQYSFSESRH